METETFSMSRQFEEWTLDNSIWTPNQLRKSHTSHKSRTSTVSGRLSPVTPPNEKWYFAGKKTPEPTATIKDLCNEPVFHHGYVSDEEVASPIGADDMSITSGSSETSPSEASDDSPPEQLAGSYSYVQQQCNRAKAVKLVAAGRVKVISVPKQVDISSSPVIKNPNGPIRMPVSRMNSVSVSGNIREYSRSSISALPLAANRDVEREKVRRRPSTPLFEAARRTPNSASSPLTPYAANFLDHDPYASADPDTCVLPPLSPSKRRFQKISSSFNIARLGIKRTTPDSGEEQENVKEQGAVKPQTMSEMKAPVSQPRLIARGANERAPPIELPPFPGEEEVTKDPNKAWPERKSSAAPTSIAQLVRGGKIKRRSKSVSAVASAMM